MLFKLTNMTDEHHRVEFRTDKRSGIFTMPVEGNVDNITVLDQGSTLSICLSEYKAPPVELGGSNKISFIPNVVISVTKFIIDGNEHLAVNGDILNAINIDPFLNTRLNAYQTPETAAINIVNIGSEAIVFGFESSNPLDLVNVNHDENSTIVVGEFTLSGRLTPNTND